MRAVAVGAVLLFHFWPNRLPGGFIGVDVFFVISGYLITLHLMNEVQRTGGLELARFWARRVKRLIPAAFLVLAATIAGVFLWVPRVHWNGFFSEIAASIFYVENWRLASLEQDYFAPTLAASPIRHYWTLSVEEQFYLLWPLFILLSILLARAFRRPFRHALLALVLAVAGFSLVHSVVLTYSDASTAYFSTFVRAWEFAFGALIAVITPRLKQAPYWLQTLVWTAGLLVLLASFLQIHGEDPFPGWIALIPVLSVSLMIAVGLHDETLLGKFVGNRPTQLMGELSYSLYLWHWPILILGAFLLGRNFTTTENFLALALIALLSYLTYRLVENPIHKAPLNSPRKVFLGLLAATVILAAVPISFWGSTSAEARTAAAAVDEAKAFLASGNERCLTPGQVEFGFTCDSISEEDQILPPPRILDAFQDEHCTEGLYTFDSLLVCESETPVNSTRKVALVGDSHTEQWRDGLNWVAEQEGIAALTIAKSSCPLIRAHRYDPHNPEPTRLERMNRTCDEWNEAVTKYLEQNPEIDTIVASASSLNQFVPTDDLSWQQTAVEGYLKAWELLPESVKHIVVIRDNPRLEDETIECMVEATMKDFNQCEVARERALLPDPQVAAATQYEGKRNVVVVDLTDAYCDDRSCYSVVAGLVALRDTHHISDLYALALAPLMQQHMRSGEVL